MEHYTETTINYEENNMDINNSYFESSTDTWLPALPLPHSAVMLVLDTSHSMWGQGLTDLQRSLAAFFHTISNENCPNAQIDIAAVSMGDNLGVLEDFTPFESSNLPKLKIRPKGDTPLGAALTLALDEIEKQTARYRSSGTPQVTPQLIVLSDGKSSDNYAHAVSRLRTLINRGKIFSRVIALGNSPDINILTQVASEQVIHADYGSMRGAFTKVGSAVSHTYEEEAPQVIMAEAQPLQPDARNKEYILDGSNILHWAGRKSVSLKNVTAITKELAQHGIQFKVVFDASAPHILNKSKERTMYENLLNNHPDKFFQIPAGTVADKFILLYAEEHPDCMIITNDLYRDHAAEHPWVKKAPRRISGMVMGERLYIPQLNMNISLK